MLFDILRSYFIEMSLCEDGMDLDVGMRDPPSPESQTVSSLIFQISALGSLLLRNRFITPILMSRHEVKFPTASK